MPAERFLITGALGCIGAWTVKALVEAGLPVAVFDLSDDPYRLRLLMAPDQLARVQFLQGDVTDLGSVRPALSASRATHVIHLAGLQVPFCRANPSLGASVNVVGTINVLEAVRQSGGQVRGLAYASSVAALGPDEYYPHKPVPDEAPQRPDTLYGVYKQANEHTARVYWQDWGVGSLGLRPYTVYGVGRDQGLTSDLTKAILAAAAGRPYHVNFGGPVALQYAEDTARLFIACARAEYQGAAACNLRNDVVEVGEFIAMLARVAPGAHITYQADRRLPFPADLDDAGIRSILRGILGELPHTPLEAAIRQTYARFRALLEAGQVDLAQLQG
jgi:UDP-glucuronate 4-epimerase